MNDIEVGSTAVVTDVYNNNSNNGLDSIDLIELENIARCSVFALAIYTHLVLIYMRPCTGMCRLCTSGMCFRRNGRNKCPCCCNCYPIRTYMKKSDNLKYHTTKNSISIYTETVIKGDNFCGLNHSGLNIITEHLSNTELLFVSFVNDTSHKVYAILLDHDKEQVIIVIRGTLSLEDCITDVICEPVEVNRCDSYEYI